MKSFTCTTRFRMHFNNYNFQKVDWAARKMGYYHLFFKKDFFIAMCKNDNFLTGRIYPASPSLHVGP